jgi:D-glycero-alpha-D-manno-heptose-7-phosphate kinase
MLIARAPVRISFAGGGTDLEAYYGKHGGFVISTTINRYFYAFLSAIPDGTVQVTSSDYRTFFRHSPEEEDEPLWDSTLSWPRAILEHFGIRSGISLFLASEIPPGTGLGSSSTVTVAIIKAISTSLGMMLSPDEIADLACHIEIEKLGQPIGKQDQYAAAFGGLNTITFSRTGVSVTPLNISPETRRQLETNILLFFVGSTRVSSDILSKQKAGSAGEEPVVIDALHQIKAAAIEVKDCLERGDLTRFGKLLDVSWQNKKRLAPGITTPLIDHCYELAQENGATGGKITGAGGGGFLMLYCREENHAEVTRALTTEGFKRMGFRFDTSGARILMNASPRLGIGHYA